MRNASPFPHGRSARVVGIASVLLLSACASAGTGGMRDFEPMGNMAQIMRGVLFTNANILFDVQTIDPDRPPNVDTSGRGATSNFSGIYTGWQVVENAAIALGESARLLSVPGRLCENGRPAPLDQADWAEYTQQLIDGSQVMLVAARARDQEAASDATNNVVESCSNCHYKYRDVEPAPRCVP